jgi:hypothetical protein
LGFGVALYLAAVSCLQRSHGAIEDEEGGIMTSVVANGIARVAGGQLAFVRTAAKAFCAAVIAALSSLAAVLVGDMGFADLTTGQWVTIALAAVAAFGGVYGITNAPAE